jgi:hypothetical protein
VEVEWEGDDGAAERVRERWALMDPYLFPWVRGGVLYFGTTQ